MSNKPADVVKRLSSIISGSGRNITVDNNWFASVDLANYLYERNLTLVGTIRKNKTQIPPEFTETKKKQPGSSQFGFQRNSTLVSYCPKKSRLVSLNHASRFEYI